MNSGRYPTGHWLTLVLSLPTENKAARMRSWRGLKGLGCAVLRDGVYLLPSAAGHEEALRKLAQGTIAAGGSAHVLKVPASAAEQSAAFKSLFDRTQEYASLGLDIERAHKGIASVRSGNPLRTVKALRRRFAAISATDFFPGPAREQMVQALSQLEAEALSRHSPGEPRAVPGEIQRLERKDYKARTWATRRRPWIDRLASAWLIRRFIDRAARFKWLDNPADCPRRAVGFDFDGAAFTHIGSRVTFEVLMASFNLESDPALRRLAALVHYLDVGGIPTPEAAGLVAVFKGARQRAPSDDALLSEGCRTFDLLYRAFTEEESPERMDARAPKLPT